MEYAPAATYKLIIFQKDYIHNMGLDDFVSDARQPDTTVQDDYPNEAGVVALLYERLSEDFESIKTYDRTSPDIIATREDEKVKIEVKGDNSSPKDRVYTGLGQVVYEMEYEDIDDENVRWGIAFPAEMGRRTEYREQVDKNISSQILELLDISVIIVSEDGNVEWYEPGKIGDEN